MHRHLLLSSALVLLFSISTAQTIKLVGPVSDPLNGSVSLRVWDAISGTILSDIPTNIDGVVMGSSAFDSKAGIYYASFTAGSQSGTYEYHVADSFRQFVPGVIDLPAATEIDMNYGKLYGLIPGPSGFDFSFFDLFNNVTTPLGNIPVSFMSAFYAGATTFDSNNHIFYVLGADTSFNTALFAIDTDDTVFTVTKTIVSGIVDPGMLTISYDNTLNQLILLLSQLNASPSGLPQLQIGPLNVSTGIFTPVHTSSFLQSFIGVTKAYDQATNSLIFAADDTLSPVLFNIYVYNVVNNTLTTGPYPENALEFEADNTVYAQNKYGSVTARPDASPSMQSSVFPNPAQDRVRLSWSGPETANVQLLDASGRLLQTFAHSNDAALDLQGLPAGMYFIRLDLAGKIEQHRLVRMN